MTAAVQPHRATAPEAPLQHLLMRFVAALTRRRAYAALHPMVVAAEEQLFDSVSAELRTRPVLTIGVAKTELLINGEALITRGSYARDLATRLHRRGVATIVVHVGVPLQELRDALTWLVTDPAVDANANDDRPPTLHAISIAKLAWDHLDTGDTTPTCATEEVVDVFDDSALERITLHERAHSGAARASAAHGTMQEASRRVQMALEIGVVSDDARSAAEWIVSSGAGSDLLRWTDECSETECAAQIRGVATSDQAIRKLLLAEPVDRLQARALLEQLDVSSAGSLIDVLELAEARGTRMIVRQRLSEFGAAITELLIARLDQAPWYLIRNILTLLHEIAVAQTGGTAGMESLARLLEHPQVQVRTEAFRLLMFDARARELAIRRGLRDEHERIVVLALQALTEPADDRAILSPPLVTQLMDLVDAGRQSDVVRARMVRALALTQSDRVRDWLIGLVVRKSRVLRRATLAEPTLTAVAATQVLARKYAADPVAIPVIAMARQDGIDRRWLPRDQGNGTEFST